MPIKTTEWSPDTCECVLRYTWDTDDVKENKTYTGTEVLNACERHSGASSPNATFGQVRADNNAKNNALKVLAQNFPQLTRTTEENDVRLINGAVSYVLRLDRVLELTIPSFSAADKISAAALIATELGEADKVIIV